MCTEPKEDKVKHPEDRGLPLKDCEVKINFSFDDIHFLL